jgi:hypothetical protein
MLRITETSDQKSCLDKCVKLCGTFNGNFEVVRNRLNRNFEDSGNENEEKSVFEQEFSPINKRYVF